MKSVLNEEMPCWVICACERDFVYRQQTFQGRQSLHERIHELQLE